MRKHKFRGKTKYDVEVLNVMQGDWVYGQVLYEGDKVYIVGEVADSCEEYINVEWWVPVEPESVEMVEGDIDA